MNTQNYSEQQWQALHEEIQTRLRVLAEEMLALAPAVKARFGKTITKRFPLFSHVSFVRPQDDASNEIIVGIDIGPEEGQWRIDADVSDEEEGTIYFELPGTPFSVASFEELTNHALRIVEQLIREGKPVVLRLLGAPGGIVAKSGSRPTRCGSEAMRCLARRICKMIKSLSLQYNRARQAQISEIGGGAAALK